MDSTPTPTRKAKLFGAFQAPANVQHVKHLLVAGRGFLNFNPASLLLLLVTSLLLLILFGGSSANRKTELVKAGWWFIQRLPDWFFLGGGVLSHLVFRCFPVFSDSLSSSLIPDSSLESDFSYSESSDLSLPSDLKKRSAFW